MPVLLKNAYFVVSHDIVRSHIGITRTTARFESLRDCEQANAAVLAALTPLARDRMTALYDLRGAPVTNDPMIERIANRSAREQLEGFKRVSVLVATTAGALQLGRLLRQGGFASTVQVYADPAEAERALRG